MTFNQAIDKAKKLARKTQDAHYVVFDYDGSEEREYHVATYDDLMTFFIGTAPRAAVDPDGSVNQNRF